MDGVRGERSREGVRSRCGVAVCALEDAVVLLTAGTGTKDEDEDEDKDKEGAADRDGALRRALRRSMLRWE